MLPNLKLLRREKGISQQTLADAIGLSQQSINQYENHNVEPDITTLKLMAGYFETTVDFIIGYTNTRYPTDSQEAYRLNDEEEGIIIKYRILNPREKQCVAQVIDTLLDK